MPCPGRPGRLSAPEVDGAWLQPHLSSLVFCHTGPQLSEKALLMLKCLLREEVLSLFCPPPKFSLSHFLT